MTLQGHGLRSWARSRTKITVKVTHLQFLQPHLQCLLKHLTIYRYTIFHISVIQNLLFSSPAITVTITSTHFAFPQRDDQAELAWVACITGVKIGGKIKGRKYQILVPYELDLCYWVQNNGTKFHPNCNNTRRCTDRQHKVLITSHHEIWKSVALCLKAKIHYTSFPVTSPSSYRLHCMPSHMIASSPARCRVVRPPGNLDRGQSFTIWLIVCFAAPQLQDGSGILRQRERFAAQVHNKLAWAKVCCVCCVVSQIPLQRLVANLL